MVELPKEMSFLLLKRTTPYNLVFFHAFEDTKHPFIRESRLERISLKREFVKVMPPILKINHYSEVQKDLHFFLLNPGRLR
jgi:hypothetical protein